MFLNSGIKKSFFLLFDVLYVWLMPPWIMLDTSFMHSLSIRHPFFLRAWCMLNGVLDGRIQNEIFKFVYAQQIWFPAGLLISSWDPGLQGFTSLYDFLPPCQVQIWPDSPSLDIISYFYPVVHWSLCYQNWYKTNTQKYFMIWILTLDTIILLHNSSH